MQSFFFQFLGAFAALANHPRLKDLNQMRSLGEIVFENSANRRNVREFSVLSKTFEEKGGWIKFSNSMYNFSSFCFYC